VSFVMFTDVECMVANMGRGQGGQESTKAKLVGAGVEACIVRSVIAVHGSSLGAATEYLGLGSELSKDFARLGRGREIRNLPEGSG
jgi:hypothetical protein